MTGQPTWLDDPTYDESPEHAAAREMRAPWDREAEEALVGLMLWDPDARRRALRECAAGDLYDPGLSSIFAAVEWLHKHGEAISAVSIHDRLRYEGVNSVQVDRIRNLELNHPATGTATYCEIVTRYARARAAMGLGEELRDAGRNAEFDRLDELVPQMNARLVPQRIHVETFDLLDLWEMAEQERDDPSKPWAIPGCLRVSEVCAITGSEGLGKSTFLRQIGTTVSVGMHPFTGLRLDMEPLTVLQVDLQEDEVDMADELAKLRRAIEPYYERGRYHAVSMPEGIDLLSSRGQRMFDGLLAEARPALVLMGPVNSMFRASDGRSRYGEDVIEELRAVMVEFMARYGFALILEGHAGNERSHDEDWRIRGSSVWRSWPAFSLGLKEVAKAPREVDVLRARRDRYSGRVWPFKLLESKGRLPWEVSNGDYAAILRHMGRHDLLGETEQQSLDEFITPAPMVEGEI